MHGATGSSGGGGRDINRRADGNYHPYTKTGGPNDLFCNRCGFCLRNQVFARRGACSGCKASIPLGSGWGYNDWGRCGGCWQYTHKDFAFCQTCGRGNNETIAKHLAEKAREVENIRRQEQEKVVKLEKQNSDKDAQILKLQEIIAAQEKSLFVDLEDNDFNNEIMELEVSSGLSQNLDVVETNGEKKADDGKASDTME